MPSVTQLSMGIKLAVLSKFQRKRSMKSKMITSSISNTGGYDVGVVMKWSIISAKMLI
jgi:hypothetical protein